MPVVARELSIIYGTETFGGGTEKYLDGKYRLAKSYTDATLEFDFVITSDTEGGFASDIEDVEDALRIPDQRLRIILGSSTLLDANPADNSGFNLRARIEKRGDLETDTGRSRLYTGIVEFELPADASGAEPGVGAPAVLRPLRRERHVARPARARLRRRRVLLRSRR